MRIALLTHEPFFPPSGGGSAAAVYLVRELTRRGHFVEVFGPALPDEPRIEQEFGIRLRPFTTWAMGRTTRWRTAKYLAYPLALERHFLRTHSPGAPPFHVLVGQHSISAVAAGRLRKRLGIPIVLNLLDCLTGFLETWPSYAMPRSAARALVGYELSLPRRTAADGVLTVSDALRERVVAGGYPASRALATYYGYDATLFRRPRTPSSVPPEPTVVMHGSFDRHHLGPIARDALLQVIARKPEVIFRFVGPATSVLRQFAEQVRHHAPQARLELTGFVPYDRIPARLSDATLGITPYQPSTGTHCAFVAKTVEYLALGLPVVSTPLKSSVSYYAGLDGITFSGPDGQGFSDAILNWLNQSPDARAETVEPARRKVEAELDWPVLTRRAVDFIETTTTRAASVE